MSKTWAQRVESIVKHLKKLPRQEAPVAESPQFECGTEVKTPNYQSERAVISDLSVDEYH